MNCPIPASIDTRELAAGGTFFALAGERDDGHAYVAEAFRRGAAAAVVRREWIAPEGVPAERLIRVDDPRSALAACARAHRDRTAARKNRTSTVPAVCSPATL